MNQNNAQKGNPAMLQLTQHHQQVGKANQVSAKSAQYLHFKKHNTGKKKEIDRQKKYSMIHKFAKSKT